MPVGDLLSFSSEITQINIEIEESLEDQSLKASIAYLLSMQSDRTPSVSGAFYPSDPEQLRDSISSAMSLVQAQLEVGPDKLIGVVVPHAGYVYSGQTAAHAYSLMKSSSPGDFVIIGPNHSSYPPEISIYPDGEWITPLGRCPVNAKEAEEIRNCTPGSKLDERAHRKEHSVEVQLPFLQYLFDGNFTFVPIIMGDQRLEMAAHLSDGLMSLGKLPFIIASSDLTHYEPLDTARRKDRMLLDAVESLDLHRFYRTLEQNVITACGYGAIATLMSVTAKLGGRMHVLNYSTSYETSGESYSVVGYAAIAAYME